MTADNPHDDKPSPRVLVVDDNDVVRKTLARTLRRLGYTAVEAASGEAALEIIAGDTATFDCMVIDRVMPGLSGPQLIHSIRAIDTEVPIVLTTGFSDDDELPAGVVNSVLSKPWTTDDVTVVMRAALGHAAEE